MNKPLAESIGFVIVGLLIGFGLRTLSDWADPVYGEEKLRATRLMEKRESIEVIDVGHSQNQALDYAVMGLNGYHQYCFGSDVFEITYLLRAIVPELPNLKVVFLNVNPLGFKQDNSADNARSDLRRKYYATTPTFRSWRLIHGDLRNLVFGKLSAIIREDHWQGVYEALASGKRVPIIVDEFGFLGPYKTQQMTTGVRTNRYEKLSTLVQLTEATYADNPQLPEDVYKVLRETLIYLSERNLRVILFTTPNTRLGNELMAQESENTFAIANQYIQKLTEEFGVEYYDFSHDQEFVDEYQFFHSEDHMNQRGARAFSQRLAEVCGFTGTDQAATRSTSGGPNSQMRFTGSAQQSAEESRTTK